MGLVWRHDGLSSQTDELWEAGETCVCFCLLGRSVSGRGPESLRGVNPDSDPKVEWHPWLEILGCPGELDVVRALDNLHSGGLSLDHLTPWRDRRIVSSVAEVQFPGERAGWYGRPILVKAGKDSNTISAPPSPSSISPFL